MTRNTKRTGVLCIMASLWVSSMGMAIMPDPKNFRRSWYHARDYGYIAANAFGRDAMKAGDKSTVTVKKGDKFHLGYGVFIYSVPAGLKVDMDHAYQDCLKQLK